MPFVRNQAPARGRFHILNMLKVMQHAEMTPLCWRVLAQMVSRMDEGCQGDATLEELTQKMGLPWSSLWYALGVLCRAGVVVVSLPGEQETYAINPKYMYVASTIARGKRRLGRAYARKQLEHWAEVTRDATS